MKLTNVRGVYAIENAANGKRYIGSATNLAARRNWHMNALRRGKHHSVHLQRAFIKHGEESFAFRVLVVCDKGNQLFYEQLLMDGYKSHDIAHGYNVAKNAEAPYGTSTEEGRKKLSATNRSKAKKYDYLGESLCIAELAEKYGIPFRLLLHRMNGLGWDVEKAITHPRKKAKRKIDRKNRQPALRKDGQPWRRLDFKFEHKGKSQTLADWAREIGCQYSSLNQRLRAGWDFEKAITTTFEDNRRVLEYQGKSLSLADWEKETGISQKTIQQRINRLGWTVDQALTIKPKYYHHEARA